ncbi:CaiB/BaiF CoA transferase family protein [Novosphingopyxis baekryungensis]|uniref:CaiB/BaiF CoA transferase family protein n=1 Tax=Novosphingopyxis baekryungensis TaxID=279369 RepID=UPI00048E4B18|nr:CoA transferase [Novosphingopyxis baekryungensis]
MAKVMEGIKVLEVAQFTFVPAAGAVLADWGADVIKIEHPVRGDTQRGFLNMGGVQLDPQRHTLFEHPNRGKRSVGIDFTTAEGQDVLHELAKQCDVFLTNYLPQHRQKYKFDIEHIRAVNPDIIYARGSAWGDKGPEREKGGFDGTAFWSRSGIADCMTPEELEGPLSQGIQAFGDSIGGMFIAGGISAALFHRLRTGEAKELDVSLLSTATWAAGANMAQALETGIVTRNSMPRSGGSSRNPFMGNFRTSDGRTINLCIVSPTGLIEDTFHHVGRPEAAADPRFKDVLSLIEHADAASEILVQAFGEKSFDYWREQLRGMKGQWAPILTLIELAEEEQIKANDHILEVDAADGSDKPLKLSRSPVEWDHEPITATRSPQPSEHTELVLMEMGVEWDRIEQWKAAGAIA